MYNIGKAITLLYSNMPDDEILVHIVYVTHDGYIAGVSSYQLIGTLFLHNRRNSITVTDILTHSPAPEWET